MLEVAGVDPVDFDGDLAVGAVGEKDVGFLARRDRPAEGVDVAVLDEGIDSRKGRVVEDRAFDLELVGILDPVAEGQKLPITALCDAIGSF